MREFCMKRREKRVFWVDRILETREKYGRAKRITIVHFVQCG